MGVMPRIRLVFNVCRGDRNTTLPLFRGLVNSAVFHVVGQTFLSLSLGNSRGQGSLKRKDQ